MTIGALLVILEKMFPKLFIPVRVLTIIKQNEGLRCYFMRLLEKTRHPRGQSVLILACGRLINLKPERYDMHLSIFFLFKDKVS